MRPLHRWPYLFIYLSLAALIFSSSGCGAASTSTVTPKSGDAQVVGSAALDAPDPNLAKVQSLMKTMTLDQKIGQMLMIEYVTTATTDASGNPATGTDFEDTDLATLFSQYYVGNFLVQEVNGNMTPPYYNTPQLFKANLIDKIQASAKIPVMTAIDEEGGEVQKLEDLYGETLPSAADMASTQDTQKVEDYGKTVSQWMKSTGINADLAPVVDVGDNTSDSSSLMTTRMFSSDPQQAATYAGAFLDGLQQNGIIGTLKHFPGLGTVSSDYDPHKTLPEVTSDLQTLQSNDFIPYQKLIKQNNPAMIMTTDVKTDALDSTTAAELSPKVINYLRNTLGYKGVIITDGLYMGGLYPDNDGADPTSDQLAQVTVQAIIAGNDILEGDSSIDNVTAIQSAIKAAMQSGEITEARIDQSVQRILLMKYDYGIIK